MIHDKLLMGPDPMLEVLEPEVNDDKGVVEASQTRTMHKLFNS